MRFKLLAKVIAEHAISITKICVATAGNVAMSAISPFATVVLTAAAATATIYDSVRASKDIATTLMLKEKELKDLLNQDEEEKEGAPFYLSLIGNKLVSLTKNALLKSANIFLGSLAAVFLLLYIAVALTYGFTDDSVAKWVASSLAGATAFVPGLINLIHNSAMRYRTYEIELKIEKRKNEVHDESKNTDDEISDELVISEKEALEKEAQETRELKQKLVKTEQELLNQKLDHDRLITEKDKRIEILEREIEELKAITQSSSLSDNPQIKPSPTRGMTS
ncbi:MAG: CvpA family protein [Proteobacteria bacterium]|nr:CvpA family protein [Pseudomonadota bacterium]